MRPAIVHPCLVHAEAAIAVVLLVISRFRRHHPQPVPKRVLEPAGVAFSEGSGHRGP
jgi:hypothetical protein